MRQQQADLEGVRRQYRQAVEENGKLEAKMQALKITQSSDTAVLREERDRVGEQADKLRIEADEWRTRYVTHSHTLRYNACIYAHSDTMHAYMHAY